MLEWVFEALAREARKVSNYRRYCEGRDGYLNKSVITE